MSLPACPLISEQPALEPRLQRRYQHLVKEHAHVSQRVAAGLSALAGTGTSFASTQAAWRFFQNPAVTLPALAQPLLQAAQAAVCGECDQYALVMHDWSHLNYSAHTRKPDRVRLSHSRDCGYELQTALLVGDRAGRPLAPLCHNVVSTAGVHATRSETVLPRQARLDELAGRMGYLAGLNLPKPLVHIIDREADSVGHYRQWQPHLYLVRAKGGQRVDLSGHNCLLGTIATELHHANGLVFSREVVFHGHAARQYVAETAVVLRRAARPHRRGEKRRMVPGAPVPLRLIISEVRAADGRVLATWHLLSNVAAAVSAGQLAQWYYWRWRIESFFKLLKGAGLQIEAWQQANGLAVAKRLLVASLACVLVWQLERSTQPAANEVRTVLVRLSGRQMKRNQPCTAPALLAGLWNLLAMLDMLEHYPPPELQRMAQNIFTPNHHANPN
jgi:hypothetical protein